MGWEEIFDNGLKLASDTVVAVWKFHSTGAAEGSNAVSGSSAGVAEGSNVASGSMTWQEETYNVTAAGFRAVISSPWYLNYIAYGNDWVPYYTADLLAFNGSAAQEALVMGGEWAMWGEYVDATNVISRSWPRASAVAEALWSRPGAGANITDATARLAAHTCRMLNRGIAAEPPSGPGFCPQEWAAPYSPPWAAAGEL
jgi:hexosaminidase